MGRIAVRLGLLALAVAGCTGSPSAEPSSVLSPEPSSIASGQSSPTEPSASPTALVRCENPYGHYVVSYPSDWFVAPDTGAFYRDCSLFGRTPIADENDPALLITLSAQPLLAHEDPFVAIAGDYEGFIVLADEAAAVAGRRAWLREFEYTVPFAFHQAGDLRTNYAVELANDWWLDASAISSPDEHSEVRAVLEAMLGSLEDLPPSE